MIDNKLQEFVSNIIAKGQITFGDVRRLQRDCLPRGITSRQELETLISLNAKVDRADQSWAQWLVAAVVDFVTAGRACERMVEEPTGKWVNGLLAAPPTSLGRRIARQLRRELARLRAAEPTGATSLAPGGARDCVVRHLPQTALPEHDLTTVWSEMTLGPSHRAALQLTSRSISLAA